MNKTINRKHVSEVNLKIILNTIFSVDSISKAELSRKLQLSKPTISENVEYLLEKGLIEKLGLGNAAVRGGRKPELLHFNNDFRYLLTIDLNLSRPIITILNLKGEISENLAINMDYTTSTARRFSRIKRAINIIINKNESIYKLVSAIGISTPGCMGTEPDGTIIVNKQFAKWNIVKLKKMLEDEYRIPVFIRNDTNAAALGELTYGYGIKYSNLVYISCGLGLGAGIIIDSKLLEGRDNAAGEIGAFISPDLLQQSIQLESKVSIPSLIRQVEDSVKSEILTSKVDKLQIHNGLDFEDICNLWEKGDSLVVNAISVLGTELGCVIANIVSLINCDIVVLGGEYLFFEKQLLPRINEIVSDNAFIAVDVVATSLSTDASVYGLLKIFRDDIFDDICKK